MIEGRTTDYEMSTGISTRLGFIFSEIN